MTNFAHTGPISTLDAHGPYVASGGYDNRVILWDAATKKGLALGMHDHLVNHCAFSADGTLLVTASSDYSARIWQLPSLRLRAVLDGHDDDVDMAVFSPDGGLIATCALDRVVRVFDVSGHLKKTFRGHTGNIISLLWRPDGKRLVSSSVDGTVREWDLEIGTQVSRHDLDTVRTDTIAIDSSGRIYAGDDRGRIAIIEHDDITYVAAHRAGIKKIIYCAAQRTLISLSYDRTLAVWQIGENGSLVERSRTKTPALVWSRAAAVLDQERLVIGTFGSRYATYDWCRDVWDIDGIESGASINAIVVYQGSTYTVGDAGIVLKDGRQHSQLGSLCNFLLPAGGRLLAGGQLGQVYDADTGRVLYEHHSPLNCGTQFLRNGRPQLAIGTYTGEVVIFDMPAGDAIAVDRVLKVYDNAVKGLVAADDKLFSVCASTDIAWHACSDLTLIRRISRAHERIANACCFAVDGLFASVARDRTLRLWRNGDQEVYPSPHVNSVKCICASADGKTLLTGSFGGTVAVFDVPSRRWTKFLRPSTSGISSIAYDPANGQFLAASYDGEIHVIH
jgi:WD40 repeat protein